MNVGVVVNSFGQYHRIYNNDIRLLNLLRSLLFLLICGPVNAVELVDLQYKIISDTSTKMILNFNKKVSPVSSYVLANPDRIVIDIPNTGSSLEKNKYRFEEGNINTIDVVTTDYRTRLVINLSNQSAFEIENFDNSVVVNIGTTPFEEKKIKSIFTDLINVDFRRGELGAGKVELSFSDDALEADIQRKGNAIVALFHNTQSSDTFIKRLDVRDFATPVAFIDTRRIGNKIELTIIPSKPSFEFLAYQADSTYSIHVSYTNNKNLPSVTDKYTGEKISLNFQDISTRGVLQQLADFSDLNLITSDSVTGNVTLRLRDVPVDMALDMVMKMKGLGQRRTGSVLSIAPLEEIIQQERSELESVQKVEELVPLMTEYIQLRYAKANDMVSILTSEQGLLSDRGNAVMDQRTNTLLIKENVSNLKKIREAIDILDVPVRQVLIEARIVVANTSVGEELGVKWGGGFYQNNSSNWTTAGGSQQTISEANQILRERAESGQATSTIELDAANIVDFGVANAAASTLALGYQTADYLLDLELAAIETDGRAEIVSQPRVITADGQKASIRSGTEIPYQEATSQGATSVSFRSAVLELEVTPQITPDDRVIMDLIVSQDSVGELTTAGPSINTNSVNTQVLVENGETIVLGGIFRSEEATTTRKTPILGDLPLIGALFRHSQQSEQKSELLVFITPRLVEEQISAR